MLRAVIGQLNDFDKGTINVSAVKEARFRPDTGIDLSEKSSAVNNQDEGKGEEENVEEQQEEDTATTDGTETVHAEIVTENGGEKNLAAAEE
ncbi:MAG: hypothetical protein IJ299_04725 [Oscillospiraceae bacterium]|nr:hypothetical protein [Oscillospiraceae bacterium]